jgi:hypothetical protein
MDSLLLIISISHSFYKLWHIFYHTPKGMVKYMPVSIWNKQVMLKPYKKISIIVSDSHIKCHRPCPPDSTKHSYNMEDSDEGWCGSNKTKAW